MRRFRPRPFAAIALALAMGGGAAASADRWLDPAKANLTPETRKVLADIAKGPSINLMRLPPAERRAGQEAFFGPLGLRSSDLTDIDERRIPGPAGPLRIRIYTPRGPHAGPRAILTYFHGGGMSMGSLEQYEGLTQRLAARSGAIIVSVDYRLTPENRFPAPVDDAYAGLKWTYANAAALGGDPARLAVGGDSAGGNLAAVMAQKARDEGGPPLVFQLLLYPAVGYGGKSRSLALFSHGYLFAADELEMALDQYVDRDQRTNPRALPINAKSFKGLPPAFVLSCEYEVMRDDIEDYAARMRAAGVPVQLKRYRGMIHPFLSMAAVIPEGRAAIDDAADALRHAASGHARP